MGNRKMLFFLRKIKINERPLVLLKANVYLRDKQSVGGKQKLLKGMVSSEKKNLINTPLINHKNPRLHAKSELKRTNAFRVMAILSLFVYLDTYTVFVSRKIL